MKITIAELKQRFRDELNAPEEFIRHLSFRRVLMRLRRAYWCGDEDAVKLIEKDIIREYEDYCKGAGLDPHADNRNEKPGYFLTHSNKQEAN